MNPDTRPPATSWDPELRIFYSFENRGTAYRGWVRSSTGTYSWRRNYDLVEALENNRPYQDAINTLAGVPPTQATPSPYILPTYLPRGYSYDPRRALLVNNQNPQQFATWDSERPTGWAWHIEDNEELASRLLRTVKPEATCDEGAQR